MFKYKLLLDQVLTNFTSPISCRFSFLESEEICIKSIYCTQCSALSYIGLVASRPIHFRIVFKMYNNLILSLHFISLKIFYSKLRISNHSFDKNRIAKYLLKQSTCTYTFCVLIFNQRFTFSMCFNCTL